MEPAKKQIQTVSQDQSYILIVEDEEPPGLIIMDYMLPEMDGVEVTRTLKT